MNADFIRKLPIPMEVKEMLPLTNSMSQTLEKRNSEIAEIFLNNSDKFLLVIGPCSADYEDSVMDYVSRLASLQEKVTDKLLIVPRIYTNKPRTTGLGYKGMLHQPNPQARPDILKGILAIRKLHMRVVDESGFASADEMLYCDNYKYLDDLLSYCTIGARSVTNQYHRLTASALDIPVGMKNPTNGDPNIMMNAITAAQSGHAFIYRGWECRSHGNPFSHAILRGYVDKDGNNHPNYHYEDLLLIAKLYSESGLENPAVIVDCNHSNSNKNCFKQVDIAKDVLNSIAKDSDIKALVKGLMIESYLEDGHQNISDGVYGKSITDPCLGWEKTERLILEIADAL